jgi:hypothetical protein
MVVGDFLSLNIGSNQNFIPTGSDVWMCLSVATMYPNPQVEISDGAIVTRILIATAISNANQNNLNCKILVTNSNYMVFNNIGVGESIVAGLVQVA